MYRADIHRFLTIFIVLIISCFKLFGQLSKQDSVILKEHGAVRLTDSINSTIPNNIRILTIDYLKKGNLNPDEYYFLNAFKPIKLESQFVNEKKIQKISVLSLQRIGALRDLSGYHVPGAAGEEGDDIWIIFENDYEKVLTISGAE